MPVKVSGFTSQQWDKTLYPTIQKATVAAAEQALTKAVAKGFDNQPIVVTDGKPRVDYRLVKPYGRIEFIRRPTMGDAVLWALDQLRRRSPVRSGRYVQSHTVFINGRAIEGDMRGGLASVKPGDRVQIVNPLPYARKLEGATANKKTGRGKRKAASKQARSGIYRVVHRAMASRFGRSLFVDFKYVKLDTGVKVWGDQGGAYRSGSAKGRAKRVLRDQVYPAIQIYIKA